MDRRGGISEVITTVLLIVVAIGLVGFVYTYATGILTRSATSSQFQVSAQIVVPAGSGSGTFVATVVNSGSVAITGISLSPVPPLAFAGGLSWNPPPPSKTNPMAPGLSTSATATVNSAVAGVSYSVVVIASFANGASSTQVVPVTATG